MLCDSDERSLSGYKFRCLWLCASYCIQFCFALLHHDRKLYVRIPLEMEYNTFYNCIVLRECHTVCAKLHAVNVQF